MSKTSEGPRGVERRTGERAEATPGDGRTGQAGAAPTAASTTRERSPCAPLDQNLPWLFPNAGWEQPWQPLPAHRAGLLGVLGDGVGVRAFVQHILRARHSVKHLRMHDLI